MKEKIQIKLSPLRGYPCIVVFFAIIFGVMFLDFLIPDRETSELENTTLQQKPSLSLTGLLQNQWTAEYADYLKDQFPFRDGLISMQNRTESLIFHKTELSGILIGKSGRLYTKQFALTENEKAQIPKNIAAIKQFSSRHADQVSVLIAPSASLIYPDDLPYFSPMLNEGEILDQIFSELNSVANIIDVRDTMASNKHEYIYYNTDHHWTTHGAYLAYIQFCNQNNLQPFDISFHNAVEVKNFYGTHYSASRYYDASPDTIIYYELGNQETIYNVVGEDNLEISKTCDLYDYDVFDTRDKYAAFLHGNNGYSTIVGDGTGNILVIKDSYANCFIPFLTANYKKIGVVDLRNFAYSIDSLMKSEEYDHVLILYSFASFKSDMRIPYLNYNPTN